MTLGLSYGYKNTVSTSDIYAQHPELWPFSKPFIEYHRTSSKTLPQSIVSTNGSRNGERINSVFIYNDPRDWGLDIAIIIDCLLSKQGFLGTISDKNGDPQLPNHGYQQDGQPPVFFSNPDLWFAADFVLPRLGQGGFKAALEGVWAEITGGAKAGVELQKQVFGKPSQETYEFAERKLRAHRRTLFRENAEMFPLRNVFMVGDNPGW